MKQYFKADRKNSAEVAVLNYVLDNCSEELFQKVKAAGKNIKDAIQYVMGEVKSRAVGRCAMVSDQEVFGLIIHYFEEDKIKKNTQVVGKASTNSNVDDEEEEENEAPKVKAKPKANKPKPAPKKEDNSNKGYEQTSLFDFM